MRIKSENNFGVKLKSSRQTFYALNILYLATDIKLQ